MSYHDRPFIPQYCASADRLMWITRSRVFYAGLLGEPCLLTRGAITIYVAIDGLLRLRREGGDWRTAEVAIVQPHVPHEIACEGRNILSVSIEPETVDIAQLPVLLRSCGVVEEAEFAAHIRAAHRNLVSLAGTTDLRPSDFDEIFFGQALPARKIDRRIATVLENFRNNPTGAGVAAECASLVNLSCSRFLHLFKEEVGISFRNVRTWKRARSLLHHVHTNGNLVNVALDIGYPDSTHFSHSIRQVYGLKPKDIIAGSRKLRVIAQTFAH